MSGYRIRKNFQTIFIKLTCSFVLVGMLPMLLLGGIFINQYAHDAREMAVSSLEQSVRYVAQSVENIFTSVDNSISMIYTYRNDRYMHVYDILEDKSLSEVEKNVYMTQMLDFWLSSNACISSLRFERANTIWHVAYADTTKSLFHMQKQPNLLGNIDEEEYVNLQVLGAVYEGDYCVNSEDYIFTIARNYLDNRSLTTSRTKILGTVYADIKVDILADVFSRVESVKESFHIVNLKNNQFVFSSDMENYGTEIQYGEEIVGNSGIVYKDSHYLIYTRIGETDCYVIEYVTEDGILNARSNTQLYMIFVLLFTLFILACIFILFSDKMSGPVETLKKAMERVQAGDLETPIFINSNDEMGYLAEGFNRMQRELSVYIDQVYKAKISKRDAELNALKMQIQPHYLYNTLDVIRMKALEHGDGETARLLEGLSRQLRYIMGRQSDEVTLREELNNIKEYFVIIKARYNGMYTLEMDVRDGDLRLKVLKLILQPVVENAVKHGLREKAGSGKVSIRVWREISCLKIMIMDNGKGICRERLAEVRHLLKDERVEANQAEVSVGLKNVYDRIQYQYGKEYGFDITGNEAFGTAVTFSLPILEAEYLEEIR